MRILVMTSRRLVCDWLVECTEEGNSDGKRALGRPRRIWKDNIEWIFKNRTRCVDWTGLAQDTVLLDTVVSFHVPKTKRNFLSR